MPKDAIPEISLSTSLRTKSRESGKLKSSLDDNGIREIPAWLEVDKSKFKGVVRDLPKREDITSLIEERLIVELYSK